MKKTFFLSILTLLLAASCAEFTDITPKGKNMLQTTDQLELLLNADIAFSSCKDFVQISGDVISAYSPVSTTINAEKKNKSYYLWTWDDTNMDALADLTTTDDVYADGYEIIGKIANPILSLADAAEGPDSQKAVLKAEAYCLRAWALYILVNKFAKAYNPATAASDPGIPVYLENDDISAYCEQWTVQQVYDQIVADAQAAISLGSLPRVASIRNRMNSACPHEILAMAYMSMQQYDKAEEAAKASLAENGAVTDYLAPEYTYYITSYILGMQYPTLNRVKYACEEDNMQTIAFEYFNSLSPELEAGVEDGHAFKTRLCTYDLMMDNMIPGSSAMGTGLMWRMTFDMSSGESYWNDFGLKTTYNYLIVAECEIAKGNLDAAMQALDAIRVCRIEPSVYAPLQGSVGTKDEAMEYLRKTMNGECWNTAYNFINRKRWNQTTDYRRTYTREILGVTYSLSPDSPLWIFPFPQNALMNPNVKQNYNR